MNIRAGSHRISEPVSNLLYISTSSVKAKDVIGAVDQLSAFTKNIELSGGCEYSENLLDSLIRIKRARGLNFLIHGYFPPSKKPFIFNFANSAATTREFITEAMSYIDRLGIPYYSVHAGFKRKFILAGEMLFESGNERAFSLKGIEENLSWFGREFPGGLIALENLYPNNNNIDCCHMMHVDEIVLAMEKFAGIHLLFDLGHLKVSSRLLGFDYSAAAELIFEKYKDRILEIHVSENDGTDDSHLLIDANSIQFKFLHKNIDIIKEHAINVTVEVRNVPVADLFACHMLINDELNSS